MNRPTDQQLIAFLEGKLSAADRDTILDQIEADPALAKELQEAAAGLAALDQGVELQPAIPLVQGAPPVGGVPLWWAAAAAVIAVAVSVPATMAFVADSQDSANSGVVAKAIDTRRNAEPGFVLVLHGRWPDAAEIDAQESERRATEYWRWTDSLTTGSALMAAGDLRWEPGQRLGPNGTTVQVSAEELDSEAFLVGMFALKAGSYEEALAIAKRCPHLRYGGSVSVRQVGSGFVAGPTVAVGES